MTVLSLQHPNAALPIRWHAVLWFIAVHLLGVAAMWYLYAVYFSWATIALAAVLFLMCHLSITAGMHRLHAHRTYRATKGLEVLLLLLSATAFQFSNYGWSFFHRMHHWFEDTDRDPYSVKHGFWWAHFRWILHTPPQVNPQSVKDLERNKLVMWQDRNYYPLAILIGLVFPTALASLWGDALGGLLVAVFLRLVFQYHFTWSINSVAHRYGSFRYVPMGTARTQGHWMWFPAITVGEGTAHERHHHAHEDYRIDPRWWALDLGKWFIQLCSLIGLASDLRTVSEDKVCERARRKLLRRP